MAHKRILANPGRLAVLALVLAISVPFGLRADETPAMPSRPAAVDFERHVAPLFGRLGCNAAACHGAFDGKGGLQLSLFGYSSKMDFQNLWDRIDREDPADSLVLRKPTGQYDHEGGVRFEVDSEPYQTICRWIEEGADWREGSGKVQQLIVEPPQLVFDGSSSADKRESKSLTVTAQFVDGSREDVTELCQFTSRDEGIATVAPTGCVTPERVGDTSIIVSYSNAFAVTIILIPYPESPCRIASNGEASFDPIDARIEEKLNKLNISPSPISGDEEFLRRITIDTIGTVPSPQEVLHFCHSDDPRKRERKIDELLAHSMHAALWATRMCDITKCDVGSMGEDPKLGRRRAQMWHDWFRKRFVSNTSYAEIVRGVITATSREGLDVIDWMKREEALIQRSRDSFMNDYADRESLDLYWRRVSPDGRFPLKETAELTAVAFTGVRLSCAQCHKHPFDRWTQNDYAAFANVFSRVVFGSSTEVNVAILAELDRRREAKKEGGTVAPLPRLREVFVSEELGRGIAGSEKGMKVLARAFESEEFDSSGDLRQQFFDWLVEPDNPYFARSFVNRVWAVYFGIGIVDPVDDFSVANPPSHPQLLEELARFFRDSHFNIRELEKQVLMSVVYQRSSTPNTSNRYDRRNFARQYVRPLMAEVALDVINKALGTSEDFADDAPRGALAIEVGTNQLSGNAGRILRVLGRGERESICDCDRRNESDLRQFIFTINDESISEKISDGSIREFLELENEPLLKQLYLRILGRHPDHSEIKIGLQHFAESKHRETAFDDLVWGLINTREFITNH